MIASSLVVLLILPISSSFHLPSIIHQQPIFATTRGAPSSGADGRHCLPTRLEATSNARDDIPATAQDLRLFLTQRCIQSFMFLLASTRDLHTVSWLDNFTQPITINNYWDEDDDYKPGSEDTFLANDRGLGSKLLNYHGLSALNTTMFPAWDSFFTTLLEQPDTVLKIKTPDSLGQRKYSEFDIDIEPARLCTRILSVREQIAREMTGDLEAIANMGQQLFASYWQNAKDRRDTKQIKAKGASSDAGDDQETSPYAFDRPSTMYVNVGLNMDPRYDDMPAPSPLRRGNFDLLYNLVTQHSIIDLLENEDGVVVGEDVVQNKASQMYLDQFYHERLVTHFVGSQWYGKGDDLIEELMLGSPILMTRNDDENIEDNQDDGKKDDENKVSRNPPLEIEPMRIAEQILLRRDKLALEWVNITKSAPSDHTDIRKLQLDRLTGVVETTPTMIVVEDDEFQ